MADTWFLGLANMILNASAARHGDLQLAAMGIVLKVERLPLNTGIGICLGMVPLLLLLDHFFGMDGLVWTQFIADIFTVILTYAVYWKLYKEPQKKMRGS